MKCSLHEYRDQSIPTVNPPTQFALVRLDRLITLIAHYEAIKVDAQTLPAAPDHPPLVYVEATLAELRRELRLREGEGAVA